MLVRYWWTEDGDAEVCESKESISEEPVECYHCMRILEKATRIKELTSQQDNEKYILCITCAEKCTQRIV